MPWLFSKAFSGPSLTVNVGQLILNNMVQTKNKKKLEMGNYPVIQRFLTEYPKYRSRIKNTETAKGEKL